MNTLEPLDRAPGLRVDQGCRTSVATTLPLRWWTTSIAPGLELDVRDPERVEHGRQHRAVGAQHGALGAVEQRVDDLDDALGARVLLAQLVVELGRPPGRVDVRPHGLHAAHAATRCAPRSRRTPRAAGTSRCGLGLAELDERAQPVVPAPGPARARLAVPQHDQRVRTASQRARLGERVAVVGVGQPGHRRLPRHPLDDVDLVVGPVAADVVAADAPWPSSSRRASSGRWTSGSAAGVSAGPSRTSSPVSSATSRTAAVTSCSPGSSLPLGNDQSSYLRAVHEQHLALRAALARDHGTGSAHVAGLTHRHDP